MPYSNVAMNGSTSKTRKVQLSIPTIVLGTVALVALTVCATLSLTPSGGANSNTTQKLLVDPRTEVAESTQTTQNELSRRNALGSMAAAVAAFAPAAASAKAGTGAKFSVFGLLGDGSSPSEGAYGNDPAQKDAYSPYSPFNSRRGEEEYKPRDDLYLNRKLDVVKETEKRLTRIPGYVEKKKWSEVTTELTRYVYETRAAMNYLAGDDSAKKTAASEFFVAIEKITIACKLKDQAAASAAHTLATEKLAAYVKMVS